MVICDFEWFERDDIGWDGRMDGWMVGWLAFEGSNELEDNYFWRFWPLNPWLTEFLTRCLCQASSRPTTPRQGRGLSDFVSFYPLMEGILHQLNFVLRRGSWETFFFHNLQFQVFATPNISMILTTQTYHKISSFSYIGFISGKKSMEFKMQQKWVTDDKSRGFGARFFWEGISPRQQSQHSNLGRFAGGVGLLPLSTPRSQSTKPIVINGRNWGP